MKFDSFCLKLDCLCILYTDIWSHFDPFSHEFWCHEQKTTAVNQLLTKQKSQSNHQEPLKKLEKIYGSSHQ